MVARQFVQDKSFMRRVLKIYVVNTTTLFLFLFLAFSLNGFMRLDSTLSVSANKQAVFESRMDVSRMMQYDPRYAIGFAILANSSENKEQFNKLFKEGLKTIGPYDRFNVSTQGVITAYADFNAENTSFITTDYSLFKKFIIVDILAFDRQFANWQAQRQEGIRKTHRNQKISNWGGSFTLNVSMPYPITSINGNNTTFKKDPNSLTINLEDEAEFINANSIQIESATDNIYGIVIVSAVGALLIFIFITGIMVKNQRAIGFSSLFFLLYIVLVLSELSSPIRFNFPNNISEHSSLNNEAVISDEQSIEVNTLDANTGVAEIKEERFYFTQNTYITNAEYDELKKMSPEYASSEIKMVQIYSKLKKSLPNDAVGLLENDQNQWLNERNQGALNAGSKGSREYLDELIQLTRERTKELSEQVASNK